MFDVGFSEILLIMVIALVVLGPDKLPKLAADIGRWVGRARAMARQLSSQLEQEVRLDEITRDGLLLSPQTVAEIGKAEARRNRWMVAALWVIAALLL